MPHFRVEGEYHPKKLPNGKLQITVTSLGHTYVYEGAGKEWVHYPEGFSVSPQIADQLEIAYRLELRKEPLVFKLVG